MPDEQDDKQKQFLEKHGGKTEEEVRKEIADKEKAKEKYTADMGIVEANLLGYLERPEPVKDPDNPEKTILVMRRPYFEELKKLLPPELADAMQNPDAPKITKEKLEEYDNQFFGIIADLVVVPEHDSEWWKVHFNGKLAKIIQKEFAQMLQDMGIEMENFREAHKET